MKIGIPLEIKPYERRIALTPKEVADLTAQGFELLVQSGAGEKSGFSDLEYQQAGAQILADLPQIYREAELIVKVKEPQPEELALLQAHHILFCYLHLGGDLELAEALRASGATSYGFECVELGGATPLLAPMSRIAGRLAVQTGAWFLQATHGGRGSLLGGFAQARGRVTIIGAGVAGRSALELAQAMGAEVVLMDINDERLSQIKEVNPSIRVLHSGARALREVLPETDLLIGAAYQLGKSAPKVVREEDLRLLPKGAVAVDIAVDQGGCFEPTRPCTHHDPVYAWEEIFISAIPNLPAAVPRSASQALGAAILPYLKQLAAGEVSAELQAAINIRAGEILISL